MADISPLLRRVMVKVVAHAKEVRVSGYRFLVDVIEW
jgi:hypothetical protein